MIIRDHIQVAITKVYILFSYPDIKEDIIMVLLLNRKINSPNVQHLQFSPEIIICCSLIFRNSKEPTQKNKPVSNLY